MDYSHIFNQDKVIILNEIKNSELNCDSINSLMIGKLNSHVTVPETYRDGNIQTFISDVIEAKINLQESKIIFPIVSKTIDGNRYHLDVPVEYTYRFTATAAEFFSQQNIPAEFKVHAKDLKVLFSFLRYIPFKSATKYNEQNEIIETILRNEEAFNNIIENTTRVLEGDKNTINSLIGKWKFTTSTFSDFVNQYPGEVPLSTLYDSAANLFAQSFEFTIEVIVDEIVDIPVNVGSGGVI